MARGRRGGRRGRRSFSKRRFGRRPFSDGYGSTFKTKARARASRREKNEDFRWLESDEA